MADPKANAEMARSLYDRWNARDFDRLAELMAKDGEIVLVGSDTRFRGPAGAIEFSQMWAEASPTDAWRSSARSRPATTSASSSRAAATHTGTLRGPGGDIPATGRSLTLHLV